MARRRGRRGRGGGKKKSAAKRVPHAARVLGRQSAHRQRTVAEALTSTKFADARSGIKYLNPADNPQVYAMNYRMPIKMIRS